MKKRIWTAIAVLTLAAVFYGGAWGEWRLGRALDAEGIATEALVTRCDHNRHIDRVYFTFEAWTPDGPRSIQGRSPGDCAEVGSRIDIRYRKSDPGAYQRNLPRPGGPPLFFALIFTLVLLPSIWPELDRPVTFLLGWGMVLAGTTVFAGLAYGALRGSSELTRAEWLGALAFGVVCHPHHFVRWWKARRSQPDSTGP